MLKHKRFIAVLCTATIGFSALSMSVFAATSVSGRSSGGSSGYANCSGSISLTNSTSAFGQDKVSATTLSDASGRLGVQAIIWYNSGSTEQSKVAQNIQDSSISVSVTAIGPNQYGNRGTAGHTFSSSNRGSWTGSTNKDF